MNDAPSMTIHDAAQGEARAGGRRIALLVIGMHRSGTSALSGMLAQIGVPVPGELIGPEPANPMGYFENRYINDFNEQLLERIGTSWDSPVPFDEALLASPGLQDARRELDALLRREFADEALVLVKDPRLCLLAPLWFEVLAGQGFEVVAALPARHPMEVADSLRARDGMARPVGLAVWLQHMLLAERVTRPFRRSFTTYEALLRDWQGIARKISGELGIVWPASLPHVADRVDGFLRRELRHHEAADAADVGSDPLEALCLRAWEAWQRLAKDPQDAAALAVLERIGGEIEGAQRLLGPALAALHASARRARALEKPHARLGHEFDRQAVLVADSRGVIDALTAEKARLLEELDAARASAAAEAARRTAELDAAQARAVAETTRLAAEAQAALAARDAERAAAAALGGERDAALNRARRLEQELQVMLASTSWRATAPLRRFATWSPGAARLVRRGARLAWWTVTFQLPRRVREYVAARRPPPAPAAQALVVQQAAGAVAWPTELPPVDAWGRYEPMRRRIEEARAQRLAAVRPEARPVIDLPAAALEREIVGLRFAVTAAPVVSIILPVSDTLKLTVECLLSVMRGTGEDIAYEVIVADDASTDRTAELLSRVPGLVVLRNDAPLGVVRSANRAAAQARGEILVFLGEDVQVTRGWLAPLVALLRTRATAGAAGPRFVTPDGRLREAGAVINPDGSTAPIAPGEDPAQPGHGFERRVDSCSRACLAVRRERFLALGGLWEDLGPEGGEDAELCLRLRAEGLETWYVPDSVLLRPPTAEGAVTGALVANRQKIAGRWRAGIDELNQLRLFAFYLPQFHPIPENDRWWGKGFTEWTNVTRAVPQYVGHYQPQLPAEMGFYDLRMPEVMEAQAALARRYGIEGFCFYYYWFAGKRLLETPIEQMLRLGKPDFPFFLCWANENWTRRWDGQDAEVLIAQQHSPEDDAAVIRDLMRYMRDPRYVRVKGRPLLVVYRVDLFPDFAATAALWRDLCRREGVGEIYLAAVESFGHAVSGSTAAAFGCDATVQFPPHGGAVDRDRSELRLRPDFEGRIYDYEASALWYLDRPFGPAPRFPGLMPAWDNTARRMKRAAIFDGATPGAFQAWLEEAIRQTRAHNHGDERIVFINAWNEWAEGAHLEPDQVFGFDHLEAVRNALAQPALTVDGAD